MSYARSNFRRTDVKRAVQALQAAHSDKNPPLTATTHPVVHHLHAGLDRHAAVLECCFLKHHVEASIGVLLH